MGSVTKPRKLQPKVTVAGVKRKWEEQYSELDTKYGNLCLAHLELAKKADEHHNAEVKLRELAEDRLILCHKMQGVIEYLEMKLGEQDGTKES